MIDIRKLLL